VIVCVRVKVARLESGAPHTHTHTADRTHSPCCSEITPAIAGSSSDLRCCGLACLRRDMLLLLLMRRLLAAASVAASAPAMLLLLLVRSVMPLRFADTSAEESE